MKLSSLEANQPNQMYHYIIDQSRISPRTFDKSLAEVYGFITEYQISGEVHRVTRLRNLSELVETAVLAGARTIVGIGDDATFLQLVELLAEKENLVLGFIPLEYGSGIADVLGLRDLQEACRAIAQRRMDKFSLGQINSLHFFNKVDFGPMADMYLNKEGYNWFKSFNLASQIKKIHTSEVIIKVDRNFTLSANIIAGAVYNSQNIKSDILDLVLVGELSSKEINKYKKELITGDYIKIPSATFLHGKVLKIDCLEPLDAVIDSTSLSRLPAVVSISPHKIDVIIGKGRES